MHGPLLPLLRALWDGGRVGLVDSQAQALATARNSTHIVSTRRKRIFFSPGSAGFSSWLSLAFDTLRPFSASRPIIQFFSATLRIISVSSATVLSRSGVSEHRSGDEKHW